MHAHNSGIRSITNIENVCPRGSPRRRQDKNTAELLYTSCDRIPLYKTTIFNLNIKTTANVPHKKMKFLD
jgi:hypothetical protein